MSRASSELPGQGAASEPAPAAEQATAEQLEALDAPYALRDEQIERYRADGYLRLKDALPPKLVAALEPEITAPVRSWSLEGFLEQIRADAGEAALQKLAAGNRKRPEDSTARTYQRAFTQRINLWRQSAAVERLVRSRRLAAIAAGLMGVEGVRLYHDQALYKEAHGGHTPWHADQFYWPLSSDHTITVWIPLQAVTAAMGPLGFARGSHLTLREAASELAISDASEALLAERLRGYEIDDAPFDLGEVSFHSGWTCHRADPNRTAQTRAAFTIIYMDSAIRMIEPQHRNHELDAALWLPGVAPGDNAASPLNPILYEHASNKQQTGRAT